MPDPLAPWGGIHPSVYSQAANMVRWAKTTPRAHSALRYQCPVTNSFVLITDETTLQSLARPRARLRYMDCGEMHLLTQDDQDDQDDSGSAVIVAPPVKP